MEMDKVHADISRHKHHAPYQSGDSCFLSRTKKVTPQNYQIL